MQSFMGVLLVACLVLLVWIEIDTAHMAHDVGVIKNTITQGK